MLFLQLKTWALHFNLCFWLLLFVLGTVPERVQGLKCYSCEGPNCSNSDQENAIQVCGKDEGACFTSDYERGCYSEAKADCIRKIYGGDCYSAGKDMELDKTLENCFGGAKEVATGQGKTCICTGEDLCNDGPLLQMGDMDDPAELAPINMAQFFSAIEADDEPVERFVRGEHDQGLECYCSNHQKPKRCRGSSTKICEKGAFCGETYNPTRNQLRRGCSVPWWVRCLKEANFTEPCFNLTEADVPDFKNKMKDCVDRNSGYEQGASILKDIEPYSSCICDKPFCNKQLSRPAPRSLEPGLKCYKCKGKDCNKTTECTNGDICMYNVYKDGWEKDCFPKWMMNCFNKVEKGNCINVNLVNVEHYKSVIGDCEETYPDHTKYANDHANGERFLQPESKTCVCDTDLCNHQKGGCVVLIPSGTIVGAGLLLVIAAVYNNYGGGEGMLRF